jgi:predicted N-formylglutamate amidohydrolase
VLHVLVNGASTGGASIELGRITISDYTDQAGNPTSRDQMIRLISETILSNVIAFEEAGVSRQELKQAVGRDGGTIIGRGIVLRTPIERRLSEEDGKLLFECYSRLIDDYNVGRLAPERINRLKERNNVSSKVGMIHESLRKRRKRGS